MNWAQAGLDVIIFWMLTTPHEFAHAWVAEKLGDPTPREEGRVTLNPLVHVDWMGTVILPALTSLFTGGFLGWGRPVNTNVARLRGHYNGLVLVALAGPASNVVFAMLMAIIGLFWIDGQQILFRAAYLSIYLALFNLLPVPPLDGSKFLLAAKVPPRIYIEVARFGFLIILIAIFSTGLGRWMSEASALTALKMFTFVRG
jgi:Zn-dependent protease